MEFGKAMSSIGPTTHKGTEGNWFRGNTGEDIKGVSRDNVREVRDYSNAVPGVGSLVGGCVNGWGRARKSRARIRS